MDDTAEQAQAHKLLGQKIQPTKRKDNALTRALRSCKLINCSNFFYRKDKYEVFIKFNTL